MNFPFNTWQFNTKNWQLSLVADRRWVIVLSEKSDQYQQRPTNQLSNANLCWQTGSDWAPDYAPSLVSTTNHMQALLDAPSVWLAADALHIRNGSLTWHWPILLLSTMFHSTNGAAATMVATIKVVKIHVPTTTGATTESFSFQIISIINLFIVYTNCRTETGKSDAPTVPNMKKPTTIYHRTIGYI